MSGRTQTDFTILSKDNYYYITPTDYDCYFYKLCDTENCLTGTHEGLHWEYLSKINKNDVNINFTQAGYETRQAFSYSSYESCLASIVKTSADVNYNGSVVLSADYKNPSFFPVAPEKTELATILETAEPAKVLEQVILLLPMILVVVVSCLGLRKGLSMLFRLLRQS